MFDIHKIKRQSMPKIPVPNFNNINRPVTNINNKNMSNGQFMQKYQNNMGMWFKDSDRDGVKNMIDCFPFDKRRQAVFSNEQIKEIQNIDWAQNQRGKKLGEGAFGVVYEVKDNPNYVIKTTKGGRDSEKYELDREYNKYEKTKNLSLTAPTYKTEQGLVREKLNIVTRAATKDDPWKTYIDPLTHVENKNLTHHQTNKIVGGINQLSHHGVRIDDAIQIGISPKNNKPYIYDMGSFMIDGKHPITDKIAKDDNDFLKQNFLKSVGKEKYFDRNYEKEQQDVLRELKGASLEKQNEWKEKSESEKVTERIVKPDTDGDKTPDEFDCQPENPKEQDWKLPKGFDKKTGQDKYGRQIVYVPVEEAYYMRGRYGSGASKAYAYGKDYDSSKKLRQFGFENKWDEHLDNYDKYEKEKQKDVALYEAELRKKELENQGYKVQPYGTKIKENISTFGSKRPGIIIKYRKQPNQYKKEIENVMQPTNVAPETSSVQNSPETKKYYGSLKQSLASREKQNVPMIELEHYEARDKVFGVGRHRILAARELGIKEIPIIVDKEIAEKYYSKYPQGYFSEKHIPDTTKIWGMKEQKDRYFQDRYDLQQEAKQKAVEEVDKKYKLIGQEIQKQKEEKQKAKEYTHDAELELLKLQIKYDDYVDSKEEIEQEDEEVDPYHAMDETGHFVFDLKKSDYDKMTQQEKDKFETEYGKQE